MGGDSRMRMIRAVIRPDREEQVINALESRIGTARFLNEDGCIWPWAATRGSSGQHRLQRAAKDHARSELNG